MQCCCSVCVCGCVCACVCAFLCVYNRCSVFRIAAHLCWNLSWQQFFFSLEISFLVRWFVCGPTSAGQLLAEVTSAVTHQQSGFSLDAKTHTLSCGCVDLREWVCVLRSYTRDASRAEGVITLRLTFGDVGLLVRQSRKKKIQPVCWDIQKDALMSNLNYCSLNEPFHSHISTNTNETFLNKSKFSLQMRKCVKMLS